jgi:hypothetical protein
MPNQNEGGEITQLELGAPINYFSKANPTAPNPAPGVVTEITGDNDYTVQIQLADDSTDYVRNVGQRDPEVSSSPPRYIETREGGDEPPGSGEGGALTP